MAGVKALRKIQLGRETDAGTAVAATAVWRGMGVIEDQRETVFPEEHVGILGGVDRVYVPKLLAGMAFDAVPATYEQLFHILEAGIKTVGTGVADGAGSGLIYAYTFPTTALNTIKTYTIEGGNNQQAEEMEYAFVSNFKLSGKGGEALMMEANWVGRQVSLSTFSDSMTIPTVEEVLFGKGKLYIDAVGGTLGGTQVTATLLEASLEVKTGIIPKFTADGSVYFTFHQFTAPEILLNLVYEHNTSAETEKAAWRAGTARKMRLEFLGSALGSAGTAHTYKTVRIDVAGKYEKFEKLGEQDGNDIVACSLRGRYNSTAALFAEIKVVNEVASVP